MFRASLTIQNGDNGFKLSFNGLNLLQKHAYANLLKILPPKKWKFSE